MTRLICLEPTDPGSSWYPFTGARPIAELSFAEAAELAAFGAKVLHPATIQPAVEASIPVTVRRTERPDGRFTTIRSHTAGGANASRQKVGSPSLPTFHTRTRRS